MIGAIEILIVLVIFGIIYSKDAIDKTWRKRPDEGVMESLAVDAKELYKANPKRLTIMVLGGVAAFVSIIGLLYYMITHPEIRRMMGFE